MPDGYRHPKPARGRRTKWGQWVEDSAPRDDFHYNRLRHVSKDAYRASRKKRNKQRHADQQISKLALKAQRRAFARSQL